MTPAIVSGFGERFACRLDTLVQVAALDDTTVTTVDLTNDGKSMPFCESDLAGRASWISLSGDRPDVLRAYLAHKAKAPGTTSACTLCPVALSTRLHPLLSGMNRIAEFPKHSMLYAEASPLSEDFALWCDACVPQLNALNESCLTMQFSGVVSGVRSRVLLDSGAGGTFISQDFVQRSGIAVVP